MKKTDKKHDNGDGNDIQCRGVDGAGKGNRERGER